MKQKKQTDPSLHNVLPQDLDAEDALLSSILIDNTRLSLVREIILPDDFYKTAHQKIFAAMLELSDKNDPVDLVTLTSCLREKGQLDEVGGAIYLSKLLDLPDTQNPVEYAKTIRDKSVKRAVIFGCNGLTKASFEDSKDASVEKLIAGIDDLHQRTMEMASRGTGADNLKFEFCELDDLFSSSIETPFQSLNETIEVLAAGELAIIGGRPGMGKTALALQFLGHTAIEKNLPVIYCGAQMSRKRIYMRILAQRCKISLRKLLRGPKDLTDDEKDALRQTHEQINEATIRDLIIRDRISVPRLQSMILNTQRQIDHSVGLIIVENVQQLFWPGKSFRFAWEEASYVCEKLKAFSYKIGVPLLISSQINRDLEDREEKRPMLSDLLGKKGEELSDLVFFPYRPNYYEKSPIEQIGRPEDDAEIIIAKGGSPASLPFTFWGDWLLWEEKK